MPNPEPKQGCCNAKLKSGKGYCGTAPMPNGRCRLHGGKSLPPGPGHPTYKHGLTSKIRSALPPRLQKHFEDAINDPNLLSSRLESGLLHSRMMELIERLDRGESGELWEQLRESYMAIKDAMKDMAAADRAAAEADKENDLVAKAYQVSLKQEAAQRLTANLKDIGEIIEKGGEDEACWKELVSIVNNKVNVSGAELKRLKDLHQMLTTEQAMGLISNLYGAVKSAITELTPEQQAVVLAKVGGNLKAIANVPEKEKDG